MADKTEKQIYYELDDVEDLACDLDMMIQGYIYARSQDTVTERMSEQLRSKSFELQEAIEKVKNYFNREGE